MDNHPFTVELAPNKYNHIEMYIVNSLGERRKEETQYSFYDTFKEATKLAAFLGAELIHDYDLSDTLALMRRLYSYKSGSNPSDTGMHFDLENAWKHEEKHLTALGFTRPMIRDTLFSHCVEIRGEDREMSRWAHENTKGPWMFAKTRFKRKYYFERVEDATIFKLHWWS